MDYFIVPNCQRSAVPAGPHSVFTMEPQYGVNTKSRVPVHPDAMGHNHFNMVPVSMVQPMDLPSRGSIGNSQNDTFAAYGGDFMYHPMSNQYHSPSPIDSIHPFNNFPSFSPINDAVTFSNIIGRYLVDASHENVSEQISPQADRFLVRERLSQLSARPPSTEEGNEGSDVGADAFLSSLIDVDEGETNTDDLVEMSHECGTESVNIGVDSSMRTTRFFNRKSQIIRPQSFIQPPVDIEMQPAVSIDRRSLEDISFLPFPMSCESPTDSFWTGYKDGDSSLFALMQNASRNYAHSFSVSTCTPSNSGSNENLFSAASSMSGDLGNERSKSFSDDHMHRFHPQNSFVRSNTLALPTVRSTFGSSNDFYLNSNFATHRNSFPGTAPPAVANVAALVPPVLQTQVNDSQRGDKFIRTSAEYPENNFHTLPFVSTAPQNVPNKICPPSTDTAPNCFRQDVPNHLQPTMQLFPVMTAAHERQYQIDNRVGLTQATKSSLRAGLSLPDFSEPLPIALPCHPIFQAPEAGHPGNEYLLPSGQNNPDFQSYLFCTATFELPQNFQPTQILHAGQVNSSFATTTATYPPQSLALPHSSIRGDITEFAPQLQQQPPTCMESFVSQQSNIMNQVNPPYADMSPLDVNMGMLSRHSSISPDATLVEIPATQNYAFFMNEGSLHDFQSNPLIHLPGVSRDSSFFRLPSSAFPQQQQIGIFNNTNVQCPPVGFPSDLEAAAVAHGFSNEVNTAPPATMLLYDTGNHANCRNSVVQQSACVNHQLSREAQNPITATTNRNQLNSVVDTLTSDKPHQPPNPRDSILSSSHGERNDKDNNDNDSNNRASVDVGAILEVPEICIPPLVDLLTVQQEFIFSPKGPSLENSNCFIRARLTFGPSATLCAALKLTAESISGGL